MTDCVVGDRVKVEFSGEVAAISADNVLTVRLPGGSTVTAVAEHVVEVRRDDPADDPIGTVRVGKGDPSKVYLAVQSAANGLRWVRLGVAPGTRWYYDGDLRGVTRVRERLAVGA